MGIGSGMSLQVGYGVETTADTPVTVTQFIPAVSETLGQDRGRVESSAIIAGRRILDSNMWNGGNIAAGGDVQHELYNKGLGKLFTGMFGTVSSTTGPVSGLYTHTWSGIGAPTSLTVQKGVPRVGLGNVTVDPYTYPGSMVESWEIKCSAGEIATFGATFASIREIGYRQVTDGVTTSGSAAVTSATAAFVQDDVGKPIAGTGIPAGATIAGVTSATAATLSANATATGTSITFTLGIALASASYPSSLKPFKGNMGSLTLGGTALAVRSWSMARQSGLATDRYHLGSRYRSVPIENNLHGISGTVEVEYRDPSVYRQYIAEGTAALVIGFSNYAGESVTFNCNVRIDGESPKVSGRDLVTMSVPYMMTGDTDAGAFSVVVVSTDSTP